MSLYVYLNAPAFGVIHRLYIKTGSEGKICAYFMIHII